MDNDETSDDNSTSTTYKSCCFKIDKDFMKFLTQITISYIILALAIYKLVSIEDKNEDKSIWISLVTLILGIFTTPTKLRRQTERTIEDHRSTSDETKN